MDGHGKARPAMDMGRHGSGAVIIWGAVRGDSGDDDNTDVSHLGGPRAFSVTQ
jgi:hypothetical protein